MITAAGLIVTLSLFGGPSQPPLSPAVTDPRCFSDQAFRDTHEKECLVDQVVATPSEGPTGGGRRLGLIGILTGGLL